jgi:hypothetical protein
MVVVLGHRANTPRWVRRFLAEGADGVEVDFFCRGGELFASHLSLVGRARLLRERIASLLTSLHILGPYPLKDILRYLPRGAPLMLDLKSQLSEECVEKLVGLSKLFDSYVSLRDYGVAPRLSDKGIRVLLSMDHRPLRVLDELAAAGAIGVSISKGYVDEELVQTLHDNGYLVAVWTVNTTEEAGRLLALGPDILVTDYPATVLQVLREKERTRREWA